MKFTKFLFALTIITHVASAGPYKDCKKSGLDDYICQKAQPGFQDCVVDGQLNISCLKATTGYKTCRIDGLSPYECIQVGPNYSDCREENKPAIRYQLTKQ